MIPAKSAAVAIGIFCLLFENEKKLFLKIDLTNFLIFTF